MGWVKRATWFDDEFRRIVDGIDTRRPPTFRLLTLHFPMEVAGEYATQVEHHTGAELILEIHGDQTYTFRDWNVYQRDNPPDFSNMR